MEDSIRAVITAAAVVFTAADSVAVHMVAASEEAASTAAVVFTAAVTIAVVAAITVMNTIIPPGMYMRRCFTWLC